MNAEFKKEYVMNMIDMRNDYHDDNTDKTEVVDGYVVYNDKYVCPVFFDNTFSLNPLYFNCEENKLHLDMRSVGVVMSTVGFHKLIDAVNAFNENAKVVDDPELITDFKEWGVN